MASFVSESGFDFRTLDLSGFASPAAVTQFTPADQSGLPFDIYTRGLYGIDGGERVTVAGDLTLADDTLSGNAFLFARQSTDENGDWRYDFRVTDTWINAFNAQIMFDFPNPTYVQALFQMLFLDNDKVQLSPFDDAFDANSGHDTVSGFGGNDVLFGNEGNDYIEGGEGRDRLDGGNGRDTLRGDWGGDRITGGRGADLLAGGSGRDTFAYLSRVDGRDTIFDFQSADVIAFKASAFGGLAIGALDPAQFVSRAADTAAQDADDRFIYNESTRELWFDSNGNGDGGLFLIARIEGFAAPTAENIVMF